MAEGEVTRYGFARACADGRYHTLLIFTDHQEVQISISPTGRSVRVYQSKRERTPDNGSTR